MHRHHVKCYKNKTMDFKVSYFGGFFYMNTNETNPFHPLLEIRKDKNKKK